MVSIAYNGDKIDINGSLRFREQNELIGSDLVGLRSTFVLAFSVVIIKSKW